MVSHKAIDCGRSSKPLQDRRPHAAVIRFVSIPGWRTRSEMRGSRMKGSYIDILLVVHYRKGLTMRGLAITLTALYLRGGVRPAELRRAAWPDVLKLLRRSGGDPSSAADALRNGGFWAEALVLDSPKLMSWAETLVDAGRALTAVDHNYPARWLRVLGGSAPPALWQTGEISALPSISVVGSRIVPSSVTKFCFGVGREAAKLGFAVVSGRAEGCDRAATKGARSVKGAVIEILPHGIDLVSAPPSGCYLSVCAPDELFSAASAMERNALIYAASSHSVIGHARFKEGGTWTGAVHAVRGRLTTLVVRQSEDQGMRALAGVGGVWLDSPSHLGAALKAKSVQRELFDSTG
jgi:hypothetical protein